PLILVQEPAKTAKDAQEIVDAVAPLIVLGPETDQARLAENVAANVEEVKAPISESVIDIATVEITQQMPDVAVDEPQIPVVILATDEGVRVLQSPNAPTPDAMTALLGSISYDDAGDVSLTGNAGGDFVRVYLNNRPIVTSQIAANGDWQAGLPSVDTGIYTLRVDELNEAGDVVARVETPFKREAAEVLAAATKPEKLVQAITVQPGATLWAIAKEQYGSGTLYTRVVEANADTIRNPDLIYPGQVFTVPD
ncbi:LysM peptidoglycan-binding domain-containing protein, partial [Planktotalea sp.]|uniref:LysM peptidoglycan-binding domain-containing protein n=1 Tax=Planktotalea sp. TaxID=2029877 RepID=UPI0025E3906E